MTPQESTLLNDLIRKIQQTQLSEKDPEAEQLLQEGLGNDPDALYMLAQTVLVQNFAIDQAKAQILQLQKQIGELQQRVNQPAKATSFLGSLLGHNDPPPPPPQYAQQSAPPAYSAPQYQTVPGTQYQPVPVQQYQPAPMQGPSFLRSAATTAAGVAAGALAFEGVESLLHGFGHGGGYGMGGFGGGGFGGGMPVEETVVNNYYGDRPEGMGEHHEHEAAYDDRPDGAKFDNANFDPKTDTDDYDRAGGGRLENASFDPKSDTDDYGADDGASFGNDDVASDDSGDSFGDGGGDDSSYV
jgi:uncharacterized protein